MLPFWVGLGCYLSCLFVHLSKQTPLPPKLSLDWGAGKTAGTATTTTTATSPLAAAAFTPALAAAAPTSAPAQAAADANDNDADVKVNPFLFCYAISSADKLKQIPKLPTLAGYPYPAGPLNVPLGVPVSTLPRNHPFRVCVWAIFFPLVLFYMIVATNKGCNRSTCRSMLRTDRRHNRRQHQKVCWGSAGLDLTGFKKDKNEALMNQKQMDLKRRHSAADAVVYATTTKAYINDRFVAARNEESTKARS